jgi:hypothetical protein
MTEQQLALSELTAAALRRMLPIAEAMAEFESRLPLGILAIVSGPTAFAG